MKKALSLAAYLLTAALFPLTAHAAGTFVFEWPGADMWAIYRGSTQVDRYMGTMSVALPAGTYRVEPVMGEGDVFRPFSFTVYDGQTTTVHKGGMLKFEWPDAAFSCVFRGSDQVARHLGSFEQALEAGSYTIQGCMGDQNRIPQGRFTIDTDYITTLSP